jgi:hypothetical protein
MPTTHLTDDEHAAVTEAIRGLIAALDLNQSSAARVLRFTTRMSRNYAAGDRPMPFVIAALLRLMIARRISPDALERLNAE